MAGAQTVLLVIIGMIAIAEGVALWQLYERFNHEMKRMQQQLANIDIDSKLNSSFADNTGRGIDNLAHIISIKIQEHFGISARSHFELIEKVKMSTRIKPELRDLLAEFFSEMTHVSYKNDHINEDERDSLQEKARIIMKTLR